MNNEEEKLWRSKLVGVARANEDGLFTYANDDMCKLFGYTMPQMVGAPIVTIQPHRFRAGHFKGFEHYVKTRKSIGLLDRRLEVYGLHKDGHEFPISVFVSVKEVNGKLVFENRIQDITMQREAERGKKFQEPPVFTDLYTLLLVESDFAAQEALIAELRANRITNRIVVVNSVQEAEDYVFARNEYALRTSLPYVVLLALLLPDVSGLVFLRSLRTNPATANVPVIITTVLPKSEEMDELIAMGNCAYVQKPVHFNAITDALGVFDMHWMVCKRLT